MRVYSLEGWSARGACQDGVDDDDDDDDEDEEKYFFFFYHLEKYVCDNSSSVTTRILFEEIRAHGFHWTQRLSFLSHHQSASLVDCSYRDELLG